MRAWLLLVVALSGCAGPWAHCGPTFTTVQWVEPGLYEAITDTTPWAAWDPGDGALPWTNTWNQSGLRLSDATLKLADPVYHTRGITAYADPIVSHISLRRDGMASAIVEGNVSDTDLRQAFQRLAEATSQADASTVDAAADAFVASRKDAGSRSAIPLDDEGTRWIEAVHWQYSARMPGPLRLDALLADLPEPRTSGPGRASAAQGNWSFAFSLPTWTLERGEQRLTVDSTGVAAYHGSGFPTLEDLQEDAAAWARDAFLPSLGFAEAEGSAYVC